MDPSKTNKFQKKNDQEDEEEVNDADMAFIDDNICGSRNKLNISINEKDDLEELDDE